MNVLQASPASMRAPAEAAPGETAKKLTLAYLTSAYARSSDTFVRDEVLGLRARGHVVHTFSIRKPPESEIISDVIRAERTSTDYILAGGKGRLIAALAATLFIRPAKFFGGLKLAAKVGWPGVKGRLWPLMYFIEAAYLARRLRALGVSHLHNHLGEGSAAVAMLAAHLADVTYSLTIHGPSEWDQPTMLALGLKVRRSAFVACISEFTRSQLFRWCDLADWPKIQLVRCGVGEAFLGQPASPPPAAPRLVCVARLGEQKGLPLLIEAAAALRGEGTRFELTLVGDGPLRGELERQINRHNLGDCVKLAGAKSSPQVRDELRGARALVLPSFAEGLPVVMMEALALHRAVIGTYIAGIPELIQPGVNGWLVPAGSIEKLADAMREALHASPEQLAALGQAGADSVRRLHNSTDQIALLEQLFAKYSNSIKPH